MELFVLILITMAGVLFHILKKQQENRGGPGVLVDYVFKNFSATLLMLGGVTITLVMSLDLATLELSRESMMLAFTIGITGNSFFNRPGGNGAKKIT